MVWIFSPLIMLHNAYNVLFQNGKVCLGVVITLFGEGETRNHLMMMFVIYTGQGDLYINT